MTENQQIAATILNQLGGQRRLIAMTSAKDFVAIDKGVQFAIGKNSKGINKVRIVLNAADTYDVEFGFARMNWTTCEHTWAVKDETKGAYAEMLMDLFESATGLYLTFGTRH
ncbi:hypothetical protein [Paraburkholderia sp. GAS32]|uniref:hypothetical protein n=1 Tax=Paraburkholderia sp. GAS32 TaxID=3035129 RepID=UPI003D1CEAD6